MPCLLLFFFSLPHWLYPKCGPQAFQIDRCIWNYQSEDSQKNCGPGFRCEMVRAVHKRNWVPRGKDDPLKGTGCFYEGGTPAARA